MRKLIIASALLFGSIQAQADPIKGGYLGHVVMVGGEFSYSPFTTSFKDFYTKYNFEYGGNLHVIVGRRTQIGLNYNLWSLGGNNLYEGNFVTGDRVNGSEYGLTIRNFRKNKGGLAPIGKFWDVGFSYAHADFKPAADNSDILAGAESRLPKSSDMLIANVSFGTQMVFWKHLVTTSGIRFGAPVYEVNSVNGTNYENFLFKRVLFKEMFGVFFGVGFLI
jgi:hypothetical protein